MNEVWKSIEGFNNYKISNLGRVKSIARYRKGKGKKKYFVNERILKTFISNSGYERATIFNKHYSIHRLIAKAFIKNPGNKDMINHIDGNKINNIVTNLQWSTNSENQLHAVKLGLKVGIKGAANSCSHSVYTINIETGEKLYHGSIHEASRTVGVSKQSLLQWLHNKHTPCQTQKIRVYYNVV